MKGGRICTAACGAWRGFEPHQAFSPFRSHRLEGGLTAWMLIDRSGKSAEMKNETECVGFDSFNKDCKAHRVFSQCRSCRGEVGFYRCSDLHATHFSVYIVTFIMNCRDVCGLGGDQLKAALCKDQGCSCSIYPHISIIVFLMSRRTMRLAKSFGRQLMSMATGFSPSQKSQRF